MNIIISVYVKLKLYLLFQASKLDIALARYLPHKPIAIGEHKKTLFSIPVMKCQNCGSDIILKLRPNNTGYYLTCSGFPKCRKLMWFPKHVIGLKVAQFSCTAVSIR